jgi:ABC-2 type transport system permease protein
MSERAAPSGLRTGIYDLGYRSYQGARLGRLYAAFSLFLFSLRAVFGLGRSMMSKVFPMGLTVVVLIPALVQLAVAAIAPEDFEFAKAENYFSFVSIVVALFCAVSSPEVIGRDQRHHTLALYFSRSLSRADYVTAKLVALGAALFLVLLSPQVILLTGNAVATDKIIDYWKDNASQLPSIIASSLLIATMMASVSLAIACQTPRRAWATGAVILYFVVATVIGSVLLETISGDGSGYALLLSPLHVPEGSVYWLFNADPDPGSDLVKADIPYVYYFLAAVGYAVAGMTVLYRRFMRLAV